LDFHKELCDLELEVTALRAAREELRAEVENLEESRDHFAGLFDAAPIGYVLLDELGRIRGLNQELASVLDIGPGANPPVPFSAFLPTEYFTAFLRHLRQLRVTRKRVRTELWLRTLKGRRLPVELVSVALPGLGDSLEIRTAVIDISERREVEQKLAQTQLNFQALVDAIEGIVWEADARTFEVLFVSRSAERILGCPVKYCYETGFWTTFTHIEDRERVLNELARVIAERTEAILEYRLIAADRRVVWVRDSVSFLEIAGQPKLCGVAVDITDRKLAEQGLIEAHDQLETRIAERTEELRSKVSELEAFSYSLSHDMRAPLRAMQGYSQILMETAGPTLSLEASDYLRRIMRSAERLDALIQDVLTYSRVARAPVELKPINLERMAETVISDHPALQAGRAEVVVERPLHNVLANEAFMSQCLTNLLANAAKFVAPGQMPRVRLRTESRGKEVQLWVEDNGIGIAPEDQARIFGIFQRVHAGPSYEGTGIGLAIVQKAVQRMGGRVGVQSAPGQGSKFWLQLASA
jgi:PAS domain S-box-containing protein